MSIKTDDPIKDLNQLQEEKDSFDFNKIVRLHCNKNTDVTGKLKIETPDTKDKVIFCALRSKAYAYQTIPDQKEKKKLKGITKNGIKTKKN